MHGGNFLPERYVVVGLSAVDAHGGVWEGPGLRESNHCFSPTSGFRNGCAAGDRACNSWA